jgi:hypothetical protein
MKTKLYVYPVFYSVIGARSKYAEKENEQNNRSFGYPACIVNHQRWFSFQRNYFWLKQPALNAESCTQILLHSQKQHAAKKPHQRISYAVYELKDLLPNVVFVNACNLEPV